MNLGVYVDALAVEAWERPAGPWVAEPQCQIRVGIGELLHSDDYDQRALEPWSTLPGTLDLEWSLTDLGLAIGAMRSARHDHALPWFEGLATKQAVLEQHERDQRLAAEAPEPLIVNSLLELDPEEYQRRADRMNEILERTLRKIADRETER